MRKRGLPFLIILWILGILFPMALLGRTWGAFGEVFDRLFSPGWMHIVMHALLYAVLGFLLAIFIKPRNGKGICLLLGMCLVVGIVHEGLQMLAAQTFPGLGAELFDLGVDLGGGTVGIALGWLARRKGKGQENKPG